MKSDAPDMWDGGRLSIMPAYADLFRRHQLTTFDAIWQFTENASVAKDLRKDRVTLRFELPGDDAAAGQNSFYIKRHRRPSWKEYLKPLLHGSTPMLGAVHEWNAINAFHRAGIPTMTNVALGCCGSDSFLITAALEGMTKLSEQIARPMTLARRHQLVAQVAEVTKRMHRAGLHHQDYYLGHLMQRDEESPIHVIDLGRARESTSLARRWIIKDLAQLNFSARSLPCTERCRFLANYLGDIPHEERRRLMAAIIRKTARIARHTAKNRL